MALIVIKRPATPPAPVTETFTKTFAGNMVDNRAMQAPSYMADKALEIASATQTRLSDVQTTAAGLRGTTFSAAFTGAAADAKTAVGLLDAYGVRVKSWVDSAVPPPVQSPPRVRPIRFNPGPIDYGTGW